MLTKKAATHTQMHAYIYAAENVPKLWVNKQARRTSYRVFPTHIHTAHTRRCEPPGQAVKRRYVRKHLAKQTEPHKATACLEARTRGRAPHNSVRGGGRRKRGSREREIRWDPSRHDQRHEETVEIARNKARNEESYTRVQGRLKTELSERWQGGFEERWKKKSAWEH